MHQHFIDTQHTYANEIEGQRVWNFSTVSVVFLFAQEGFVHRILHNEMDNKLVELVGEDEGVEKETIIDQLIVDYYDEMVLNTEQNQFAKEQSLLVRQL